VTRTWIARAFTALEDVVYVGLGLLLGASALVLLVSGPMTPQSPKTNHRQKKIKTVPRALRAG
jgi:hypothetical protein